MEIKETRPPDLLAETKAMQDSFKQAAEKYILPRFQKLTDIEVIKPGKLDQLITAADVEASNFLLKISTLKSQEFWNGLR